MSIESGDSYKLLLPDRATQDEIWPYLGEALPLYWMEAFRIAPGAEMIIPGFYMGQKIVGSGRYSRGNANPVIFERYHQGLGINPGMFALLWPVIEDDPNDRMTRAALYSIGARVMGYLPIAQRSVVLTVPKHIAEINPMLTDGQYDASEMAIVTLIGWIGNHGDDSRKFSLIQFFPMTQALAEMDDDFLTQRGYFPIVKPSRRV